MDTDDDPVIAELKRLREGRGLTIVGLKDSPAILAALDTADPREAYRGLPDSPTQRLRSSGNRGIKTVTRWSDQTLRELRARIDSRPFTGHVLVTAGVYSDRVANISVLRYETDREVLSHGDDQHLGNPEEGPSPPLVLYGFPRDWQPAAIHFVIQFLDDKIQGVGSHRR